jgi:hypothetical protein
MRLSNLMCVMCAFYEFFSLVIDQRGTVISAVLSTQIIDKQLHLYHSAHFTVM